MKREDDQRNRDPEAALSTSSSHQDLQKAQTGKADGEQSENAEASRQGANLRPIKPSPDSIPLVHPPPPPAGDSTQSNSRGNSKPPLPRLMHPFLHKVPMQLRYAVYGTLSSALFMVIYNIAVEKYGHLYVPSTIYAVAYLIFIPIQHAMASCMVFGWPDRYFPSLTSNVPVGLSAIALGSYLTAYLDHRKFNEAVENMVQARGWWKVAPTSNVSSKGDSKNEFYTSLFVLVVTSIWSFLLSVFVNAPAETPDKKEL